MLYPSLSSPRPLTARRPLLLGALWPALVAALFLTLLAAPRAAHSQTSPWTVVDYASYPKNGTSDVFGRLLWKNTNGIYALWDIGVNGAVVKGKYITPPPGYTLKQFYVPKDYGSPDTHLLWDNPTTGKCLIWSITSDFSSITQSHEIKYPTTKTLPGFIAYNPVAHTIYLSWIPTNGSFFFWSVNLSTGLPYSTTPAYGPYAGLKPDHFGYYSDFRTEQQMEVLLLGTETKQVGLMTIYNEGGASTPRKYGPYATVTPYAISGDRIMWIYDSGKIALWQLQQGSWDITNSHVWGPIAGVTPVSFSLDNNGFTHLLWKYENGKAALWTLSQQMQNINAGYTYGPIY